MYTFQASQILYQTWRADQERDSDWRAQVSTEWGSQKKLLQKNERYMRLNTDEEIEKMTLPELHSLVAKFQQPITPNMVAP